MKKTKEKVFWNKIKKLFSNIFNYSKKNDIALPNGKIENYSEKVKDDYFISNLKNSTDEKDTHILQLQKDFESGKINEENISLEDIKKLRELYDNQINDLKKSIEICKNKIIKIKNNKK